MLEKNGYIDNEKLYLSSEIKLSKGRGDLFKYVLKDCDIKDTYMVTTYVNNNVKSKAIVNKFGFEVLEKKERGLKYINSFCNLRKKLEEYVM